MLNQKIVGTDKAKVTKFIEVMSKQIVPVKTMRVSWNERVFGNKILYAIYRGIKFFYTSLWFYFAPFLTIGLQFWLMDAQLEVVNLETENKLREEYLKSFYD